MNNEIKTKFGTAKIDGRGYYQITSRKEGNPGKRLHRLIYESIWGKIPQGYHIHHIDGDKTNNCILNLMMVKNGEHHKLYHSGENSYWYGKKNHEHSKRMSGKNNPFYGKTHTEETRKKIRESGKWKTGENHPNYGKNFSTKQRMNMSVPQNKTGFFRVHKHKREACRQGFRWVYTWELKGKRGYLNSVDLVKLKQKVLEKGLDWCIVNEEKAKNTCKEYGYDFKVLGV